MIKNIFLILFSATFVTGCGSLIKKPKDFDMAVAHTGTKHTKTKDHLVPLKSGSYSTPCINLPFIDKNYPEHLGEVIRVYNPKVDPVGAYKISKKIIMEEKKSKTHIIDTKSVKLCKVGDELGFVFKAVKVN
jgi:PBP1b-binding outer membrane lipoprotein LpoB